MHLDPVPLTYISWSSDFDNIYLIVLQFSATVMAARLKPCIVIVLDILFKHAPWLGTLDLYFTVQWLWQYLPRSLRILSTCDSCEVETLHNNCPWHTLQARTLTWWPWPIFYGPLTLWIFTSKFGFLCNYHSYKCETVHSYCPRHSLQARTLIRYPWPIFHGPST